MVARAAKKLTVNVMVAGEVGDPVLLKAGDPVPAEYADQVGDHCFAKQDTDDSAGGPPSDSE